MVREAASELQEVISTNMPLSGLAKILISTYYGAFTNTVALARCVGKMFSHRSLLLRTRALF